jgi:hypothetical protein
MQSSRPLVFLPMWRTAKEAGENMDSSFGPIVLVLPAYPVILCDHDKKPSVTNNSNRDHSSSTSNTGSFLYDNESTGEGQVKEEEVQGQCLPCFTRAEYTQGVIRTNTVEKLTGTDYVVAYYQAPESSSSSITRTTIPHPLAARFTKRNKPTLFTHIPSTIIIAKLSNSGQQQIDVSSVFISMLPTVLRVDWLFRCADAINDCSNDDDEEEEQEQDGEVSANEQREITENWLQNKQLCGSVSGTQLADISTMHNIACVTRCVQC